MYPGETTVIGIETLSDRSVRVLMSGRIGWDADARIKERLALEFGDTFLSATVVLDLTEVRFVDSAGLSSLLALRGHLSEQGGRLVFCEVPPRIRRMFELVGMYRLIPVVSDPQPAHGELVS